MFDNRQKKENEKKRKTKEEKKHAHKMWFIKIQFTHDEFFFVYGKKIRMTNVKEQNIEVRSWHLNKIIECEKNIYKFNWIATY